MYKQQLIHYLIHEIEGYFETDHPQDRGGRTRYGITQQEVEKKGIDFESIDYDFAQQWYSSEYWNAQNLDLLDNALIQFRLFVDGVHVGINQPILFLQRTLNALNLQGNRWADIKEDGLLGQITAQTLQNYKSNDYIADPGMSELSEMLRAQTFVYYLQIVRNRESQEIWFNGWKNRLKHSLTDMPDFDQS